MSKPTGARKRSWIRRLLRVTGWTAGGLLTLILVLPIAAYFWLISSAGGSFLRKEALQKINAAIAGRIEIDHLSISRLLHVQLDGVRLFAPHDPHPVVAVRRIVVDLRLLGLISRRLDVSDLELDQPVANVVQEGHTTNLSRAIASRGRRTRQKGQPSHPPQIEIDAPQITVKDGSVRFAGKQALAADRVNLKAALHGELDDLSVTVGLHLRATEPITRDVNLSLSGHYGAREVQVRSLDLETGHSHVQLAGSAYLDGSAAALDLKDVLLAPSDVDAFAPKLHLVADLRLAGKARLAHRDVHASLHLSLPGGRINLAGNAQLDRRQYEATIDLEDVEPRRLIQGLPPALLRGRIAVDGQGWPPEEHGSVRVNISGSRLRRVPITRLTLDAEVDGKRARINELLVHAAKVELQAHGDVDATRAKLQFVLNAPDLAETRDLIANGLSRPIPPIAGDLHLNGTFDGPYRSPGFAVKIQASSLTVASNRARDLTADVTLKGLRPTPIGRFDVSLSRLEVGGKSGSNLELRGAIDGRRVRVAAAGSYDRMPIQLAVHGERKTRRRDEERWNIDTLHAQALGMEIDSLRRFTVAFGGGRETIGGLVLDAGPLGRGSISGSVAPKGRLRANVSWRDLHLQKVPRRIVPKGIDLRGLVGLRLRAGGTIRAPVGSVALRVQHGRYNALTRINMNLSARYAKRRVRVRLAAAVAQGRIRLSANVPVIPLKQLARRPRIPARADLALENVELAPIASLTRRPLTLAGTLDATVRLRGTLRAPDLHSNVRITQASAFGASDIDARFTGSIEHERVHVTLDAQRPGAGVTIDGLTELREPLNWQKLPIDASLELRQVNLSWLEGFSRLPADLAGSLAGKVTVSGTVDAPRVNAIILADGIAAAGYKDLSAVVDLQAFDTVQLDLTSWLSGTTLAELDAFAGAPIGRLTTMSQRDLFAVPFRINAELAPTELQRLLHGRFRGTAGMTLAAGGTLDHPSVHLTADGKNLGLGGGTHAGAFQARLDYEKETTFLKADLTTPGGSLTANGTMTGALGATVLLRRRAAVLDYPIRDFGIEARQFDLSVLTGLSDPINELAGILDFSLAPQQPVVTLRDWSRSLRAHLSIQHGKVSIVEFGTFSDIALKAAESGTTGHFAVSEFKGRSGSGGFEMPSNVNGKEGIYFDLHGRQGLLTGSFALDLKKFPFVQGYQTRAVISLNIRTEASAVYPITIDFRRHSFTIDRLVLGRGEVTIPGTIPKNVESLAPNPDIVIINKQKKPKHSSAKPWTFALNDLQIPEHECKSKQEADCGPLVVHAPFDNRIVVSTNKVRPFRFDLKPQHTPPAVAKGVIQFDGTVNLIKSRFNLDRVDAGELSYIDFTGQPITNPRLNLKATLENESQRLVVNLTGTLKHPHPKFEAEPPFANDSEVYYFIATGERQTRPQQNDPTAVQTQLVNAGIAVLGSAAFGVVTNALQGLLPPEARLDVLEIAPSTTAGGGIGSIRAGKRYLNGKLLIAGQYNPGANPLLNENTYELRANYRIAGNQYLQGLAGTAGTYALKYLWQKDFCSPRQSRAGLCSRCSDDAALAGKCCTPVERSAGKCQCTAQMQRDGRCLKRECFGGAHLPASKCVCTPVDQKTGRCAEKARYP